MPRVCSKFVETKYPSHQYVCCDSLLLFQIYYYRWKKRHTSQATARDIEPVEDTPLLGSAVDPERTSCWSMENEVLKYSLYLIFVVASGILAWTIDMKIHGPRQPSEPEGIIEWRSQILGWVGSAMFCTSSTVFNFAFCPPNPPMPHKWALAYHKSVSDLAVSIGTFFSCTPFTVKNVETKCEGLSPALFLFSISGNSTYAISIFFASTKARYLLANAPWLAGSVVVVSFWQTY